MYTEYSVTYVILDSVSSFCFHRPLDICVQFFPFNSTGFRYSWHFVSVRLDQLNLCPVPENQPFMFWCTTVNISTLADLVDGKGTYIYFNKNRKIIIINTQFWVPYLNCGEASKHGMSYKTTFALNTRSDNLKTKIVLTPRTVNFKILIAVII